MKKLIFVAAMLATTGSITAQEVIKSTEIGDFQTITLMGNLAVELVPDEVNGIEVNLYESAADRFRWSVSKENVLKVELRPTAGKKPHAEVRIHYKGALQGIVADEARLMSTKTIEAHCLRIELSRGASANFTVDAKDLELDAKGGSAATLKGTAKYLEIKASERSNIDAKTLSSMSSEVTATMGSEIFVNASERLVALTRMGGTIYYFGVPTILKNLSLRGGSGGSVFSISDPTKH